MAVITRPRRKRVFQRFIDNLENRFLAIISQYLPCRCGVAGHPCWALCLETRKRNRRRAACRLRPGSPCDSAARWLGSECHAALGCQIPLRRLRTRRQTIPQPICSCNSRRRSLPRICAKSCVGIVATMAQTRRPLLGAPAARCPILRGSLVRLSDGG